MRSAACQCAPILAADPQGCAQQDEVFDDELSGYYGERRKASSRCLPNAGGREQKAQCGQEHADSQRAADQGGADGKRPGGNEESDHDFRDAHQGGKGSDAENRIGPTHQRTVGDKAGDSLSLVGREFHAANPQENQDEAISNGILPHGFQRLRPGGGHRVSSI